MGLVNELQESAEKDDVLTVLRKAKRLSSKLGLPDISEWLDYEQNGYPDKSKVPKYRLVKTTIHYNTNGYIPAGMGLAVKGIVPVPGYEDFVLDTALLEPISAVTTWIEQLATGKGALYYPMSRELSDQIRSGLDHAFPEVLNQLTFLSQINTSQVRAIPDQVKDRVLDWACKLEAAGVTGEGHTFTQNERATAHQFVFNMKDSTVERINTGNTSIQGSTVGQFSNTGDVSGVVTQTTAAAADEAKKPWWDHLLTMTNIVVALVTITTGIVGWYVAHKQAGVWFFGAK